MEEEVAREWRAACPTEGLTLSSCGDKNKVTAKDVARHVWVLMPLVQRWPDRPPPAAALHKRLAAFERIHETAVESPGWQIQQCIIIHRLLAKVRSLHRKAKTSYNPEVTALKAIIKRRAKALTSVLLNCQIGVWFLVGGQCLVGASKWGKSGHTLCFFF